MVFNRISARRGQDVNLDATFYQGGVPTDPFAIYRVELYRAKVEDCNIVDAIDVENPDSSAYPSPLIRQPEEISSSLPDCGPDSPGCTEPATSTEGKFRLTWSVPVDVVVPDVYFDVWYFWPTDPRTGTEDLSDHLSSLQKQINRFWIYPDQWYVDGGLETIRFGFEPLDIKFKKPERRPIEVGIMPLPLYDYNYNLVMPLIPYLEPTITIWTENNELVLDNAKATIKLRQGAFRSNPWVFSYMLDTCKLYIGTYKYRIKVTLPDGSSRVSGDMIFTVS